ncbi:MAG TPA: universal stress protein [Pseudonocardiaceae bacterium]
MTTTPQTQVSARRPSALASRSAEWDPEATSRVLVSADGSYWGRMALRWACEHAWLANAELEVHAPPTTRPRAHVGDDGIGGIARKYPLLRIRVRSTDNPAASLIEASGDANLVVMGCRDDTQHGIGLGGCVLPVAAGARCDVVVVGGRPRAINGGYRSITVVLGSPTDDHALRTASRFADLRRVPLRILRPVPIPMSRPALSAGMDRYFDTLDEAAGRVHSWAPKVRTATEVVWSNAQEVAMNATETDLLVLGANGHLNPVGRTALFHINVPVLIARPAHAPAMATPRPRLAR